MSHEDGPAFRMTGPARRSAVRVVLCLMLVFAPLQAGGPLIVRNGQPGHWAGPIPFALDQGPLGPLGNSLAADLVQKAVSRWEAVPSSNIAFDQQDGLPIDVTADNILDFFSGRPIGGGDRHPENPIIFDDDGEIIDLLMGTGAKSTVLAFAGPRFINTQTQEFVSAFAVFNGRFAGRETYLSTVVHELGHLIGLDHTQANRRFAVNGDPTDNHLVPLMYPFALAGAVDAPQRDDTAWVSWLAPGPDFESTSGRISGTVRRREGTPLLGANVMAVQVDSSLNESDNEVVSVVSGFLSSASGDYLLPGLPPGDYVVFIEPLDPQFVGGSSVGPFDVRFSDFPKDYYNGPEEGGTSADNPISRTVLRVQAGQERSGIDMVANEDNLAPVVEAGEAQTVQSGDFVQLLATVSDPDGDTVSLSWKQIEGSAVSLSTQDTLGTSFVAPGLNVAEALVFEITGDDGKLQSSDQVRITVLPVPGNRPPIVSAGADQVAVKGQLVILRGSASDPDGDSLTLAWDQISGPRVDLINISAADARFTAPSLERTQELVFRLSASDGKGGDAESRATVTVVRNRPPTVEIPAVLTAAADSPVVLRAEAQDQDGDVLSFAWQQLEGPPVGLSGSTSSTAQFTTTDKVPTFYRFRVTVHDGGASATGETIVVVPSSLPVLLPQTLRIGAELLDNSFVAAAVVNVSDGDNPLFLNALDQDGQVIPLELPPKTLPTGSQWAFLTRDLLGSDPLPGALTLLGIEGDLQGFFLFGDDESLRLDGVGGLLASSRELYLPRFVHSADRSTVLFLHNPESAAAATLDLQVFDLQGELEDEVQLTLAPLGSLTRTAQDLFGFEEGETRQGYLVIRSDRPLRGLGLEISEDSFVSMPAEPAVETTHLSAAHFFAGSSGESTQIQLLNAGDQPMQVRITAFDDQSTELGAAAFEVAPGHLLLREVTDLLGDLPDQGVMGGYLELQVNSGTAGPFVIPARTVGAVEFSSSGGGSRTALQMSHRPESEIRFLHVAQSKEAGLFHGLAILNPNSDEIEVTVMAFDSQGRETASAQLRLAPGHRAVDLLNSEIFFGDGFDQAGGHLRLKATAPIQAFSLFGSSDFLAAVRGQSPTSN